MFILNFQKLTIAENREEHIGTYFILNFPLIYRIGKAQQYEIHRIVMSCLVKSYGKMNSFRYTRCNFCQQL
jgi:hypothetical protein